MREAPCDSASGVKSPGVAPGFEAANSLTGADLFVTFPNTGPSIGVEERGATDGCPKDGSDKLGESAW